MRDDDGIPIAGGDAAEQFFPVLRLEVFFARHEDVCSRIQHEQFGGELAEHVIGNGEHRLARQPQPLQLHRGGNHGVGLARTDDMAEQYVGVCKMRHTRLWWSVELPAALAPGKVRCSPLNVRTRQ